MQLRTLFASPLVFAAMLFFPAALVAGCGSAPHDPNGATGTDEAHWDSAGGNPTHATHSYLTEQAIAWTSSSYPEVGQYRDDLLRGANEEIHDLVLQDPELEALRLEVSGTNGGCLYPDKMWAHAVERHAASDTSKAYWYLGIVLHYVEDMGVPAHALGVYHQSSPSNWDNFEVLAFQNWSPDYSQINRDDPGLADPSAYVAFSGAWTADDFATTWPDQTYNRKFFHKTWLFASDTEKGFMMNRQGRSAVAAYWALWTAASSW